MQLLLRLEFIYFPYFFCFAFFNVSPSETAFRLKFTFDLILALNLTLKLGFHLLNKFVLFLLQWTPFKTMKNAFIST